MESKKRSSSYAKRRRNGNVDNETSDSEAEMQIRAGLRVPANRSQSIPRKYISKNQFDRQVRSAVVEAFNDCMNESHRSRSVDEAGSRRKRRHRRSDKGKEREERKESEEREERGDGERVNRQRIPAVEGRSANLTDRAKNKSVKKPAALEIYYENPVGDPGTGFNQPHDGTLKIVLDMISKVVKGLTNLIIFISNLIMNSRIVPAIEQYFARMPKGPTYVVLFMVLFVGFLLAWAYEVGEPLERIREALAVLFKKPNRSWWNFF